MGIVFGHLEGELPARHLEGITPDSTLSETAEAVRGAFRLPADRSLRLSFQEQVLGDPSKPLAHWRVPGDAIIYVEVA
jgi:hypothetical protein